PCSRTPASRRSIPSGRISTPTGTSRSACAARERNRTRSSTCCRRATACTIGWSGRRWSPWPSPKTIKLEVGGLIPISKLRLFARKFKRKGHGKDHWNRPRDDQLLRRDHGGRQAQGDRELGRRPHHALHRRLHGGRGNPR